MISVSPGLILILGALPLPLLPGLLRKAYMLALPLLALAVVFTLEPGNFWAFGLMGLDLTVVRVDSLSTVFGAIFCIAAALGVIYSFHDRDPVQQVCGLLYAGAAIGAVYAGDLMTLFVFWEGTAIASVFLIWARGTERAYAAGLRYLIIQIGSGVLLMAGAIFVFRDSGSLAFDTLELGNLGANLIFLAFGIKCAFPLLHAWLEDAYPEATVTGTVILSAFTTKLAVYCLARSFAGTELLIYIGITMAAFPIFFAVLENDLRRVLSYSLNNQLGFMVAAVGVGTPLALNGAVAHAVCHILYKALLFMSVGAVLHRTGTARASDLGGLFKSMPWTAGFCLIGAASISAVPLFCAFVSKSMILSALAGEGYFVPWVVLLFASACVFLYSAVKIPYFAFFGEDRGLQTEEAPGNMLWAMGLTAFLCIGIGVYPEPLYALLPFPVDYHVYTADHILTQMQMLVFSALAFALLLRSGLYPKQVPSVNLDADWLYRKLLPGAVALGSAVFKPVEMGLRQAGLRAVYAVIVKAERHYGPTGLFGRTWSIGDTVLWVTVLLGGYLIVYFV